ncbi:unnamed protein product [Closterium sp. NIES-65]|nr:unnamed protein product [Closterium sp. NIES-65]
MVRRRLVSGLPTSLAPLPRSPAPPCTPSVKGRQRPAPHLDVWGPSPVLGPHQERYFLIVVDEYSHYTTVFPLRRKADVPTVLEPCLLARDGSQGLYGLCLHSDRGGKFSSTRLERFYEGRRIIHRPGSPPPPPLCVLPRQDTAASSQRPRPASPPSFPSVPEFPPRSSLRPVAAEPGGVPAGGTGGPEGVGGGGAGPGGAGARGTGTLVPTTCTVRFLTNEQRVLRLEREEREWFERAQQQQQQEQSQS